MVDWASDPKTHICHDLTVVLTLTSTFNYAGLPMHVIERDIEEDANIMASLLHM